MAAGATAIVNRLVLVDANTTDIIGNKKKDNITGNSPGDKSNKEEEICLQIIVAVD
jgi:hypothetical protein